MTTATLNDKALLAAPKHAGAPASATMVRVSRLYGPSPLRQMREMYALRFGPGKLALPEYYSNGLYDPDIPMAAKKQYVGKIGSWLINTRLSPDLLTRTRHFIEDKVMYTALLDRLGLPTTHTQAAAQADRNFGCIPALRTATELHQFLTSDAVYPLFGKPCAGRGSVGSALFTGVENGEIVMGNGQRANLDAFCEEVFADFPDGFIFQTALTQHPALSEIAGSAIGTMRVVTIRDETGIRVLYTVWKVPSPTAMSDNFWQKGSMVAQVLDSGRVGKCRIGTGLDGRWIDTHPITGQAFEGFCIPHWDAVTRTACEGHALFPEFGMVGWDVAITPDGPVLIECNDNPFHVLWQLANGQGIRNPDFMHAFDKAAAFSNQMLKGRIDLFNQREKAKVA